MKSFYRGLLPACAVALFLTLAVTAIAASAVPIKLTGTSVVNGDPFAGASFTTTGTGTHLGAFTGTGTVLFTFQPSGLVLGEGTVTFVAANGDQLETEFSGFLDPATGAATVTFVILGGTGRFADAEGQFIADVATIPGPQPTFTFNADGTITF
jgi:hypothetical protein